MTNNHTERVAAVLDDFDDPRMNTTEGSNEVLDENDYPGRFIDGIDDGDILFVDHIDGSYGITATSGVDSTSVLLDGPGASELNEWLTRELNGDTVEPTEGETA